MQETQVRKRNRLPLSEYRGEKAYLLTLATAGRIPRFLDANIVEQCLAELRSAAQEFEFDVYAYCFMPDQLHLLVGGRSENSYLISFVKSFKQRTGFWFASGRGGLKASPTGYSATNTLWQRSYHDHVLRSDESLRLAGEYVVANPVEAGLVEQPEDYPYSGSLVWPDLLSTRTSVSNKREAVASGSEGLSNVR